MDANKTKEETDRMGAKAKIKFMKMCEYWGREKGSRLKCLYWNGKRKYRYIEKRTCRDKRYKQTISVEDYETSKTM